MTAFDIEMVLNNRMEEFRLAHPIDVIYANTDYTPIVGVNYIKVDFLPATSESQTIGLNSRNRITGIYQFMINVSSSLGKSDVKGITEGIHDFFKRGTGIVLNGVKVRVLKFKLAHYMESPSSFIQVIRIEFRSDIVN